MLHEVRDNLNSLITINKTSDRTYTAEYNDKLVYQEIDKVISIFGDVKLYSDSVNNTLADNILKRVIADIFINKFKEEAISESQVATIEHKYLDKPNKLLFSVNKIEEKEWGKGIIYSMKDTAFI